MVEVSEQSWLIMSEQQNRSINVYYMNEQRNLGFDGINVWI